MRTRGRWRAVPTVAIAIALACGSRSEELGGGAAADTAAAEPAGQTGGPALADLEGTAWRLVGYGPEEPVPDSIEITAGFAEGRIAGHSACNRYTGPVEVDAATGSFKTGRLVSTKMACPPAEMESESRFLDELKSVTRFEIAGARVTLHTEDRSGRTSTLVFERVDGNR